MLQKCSIWRVANVFFKQPSKKLSVAEISRTAALAPTAVRNHLQELEVQNIIRKEHEERGARTFPVFFANRDTETYKHYKLLANLESLHAPVRNIVKTTGARTIVVFGSYRYGEDDEMSDIDLFIEGANATIDTERINNELKRRVQLHTTPFRKLSENMRQSVINGIVLYGSIELP